MINGIWNMEYGIWNMEYGICNTHIHINLFNTTNILKY